jgi:hypothetical protein
VTKGYARPPDAHSNRTMNRALALVWARGCDGVNECWRECYEAARDTIVDGEMDEWDRKMATTSAYWHQTHWHRTHR